MRRTSHRMPIVLGTFTSSSTKFVDLSYYAQSCRDSMKVLQPLVAKNARRSSSVCFRWQTRQLELLHGCLKVAELHTISTYFSSKMKLFELFVSFLLSISEIV